MVGDTQPRDVERALIKRLRALKLPERFVKQLDEVEHLIGENQLRLLKATKVESANYGFALLAHELEILDGVCVGVASATKALKLNESEVRSCVVQLESIQSTMVILQVRSTLVCVSHTCRIDR